LITGLASLAEKAHIPVSCARSGAMLGLFFTDQPVKSFADAKNQIYSDFHYITKECWKTEFTWRPRSLKRFLYPLPTITRPSNKPSPPLKPCFPTFKKAHENKNPCQLTIRRGF
jgi:hypothetical protein